jgi:hypothetical protein
MAVAKLTKSKRALQFIDEEGNVFQASAELMAKLISGDFKGQFLLLTKMPFQVAKDRFKPSPVFGVATPAVAFDGTRKTDALSRVYDKAKSEERSFDDNKTVEW